MSPDRKTSVSIPAAKPLRPSPAARARAALAALRGAPRTAWRAALEHAPRARRVAAGAAAAWSAARSRPDAVLAVVLLLGVFLMVLHWKGSPIEPDVPQREAAQQHAVAGP